MHGQEFNRLLATICGDPEMLNIGTTNKCNLCCVHCARNSGDTEPCLLPGKIILDVIKEFAEFGGRTVTFGGGEVFTRSDAISLIEYALQKGLTVNVETNGTLINQEIVARLVPYKENIGFSISIDSLLPEVHDEFRGVGGAHSAAVRGILFLRKADLSVSVVTVLNRKNINDVEEIAFYALSEWDANHRLLPILNEEGRGATSEGRKWALSFGEVYNFLSSRYWKMWHELSGSFPEKEIVVAIPRALIPSDIPIYPACLWGVRMIGLGVDGSIGLCHYSSEEPGLTAGIAGEDSLREIWHKSSLFAELRSLNRKRLKGVCGNCVYGNTCRGLCRLAAFKKYGRIDAPHPVCQSFYEHGFFPVDSLVDPKKDCHYFAFSGGEN